jgi:hypothetical protein
LDEIQNHQIGAMGNIFRPNSLQMENSIMDSVTIVRIVAGLLALFVLPVVIIPYWMIFKKAGFAPALSLLIVIPLVNLIVIYVIAFSDWKFDASRVPQSSQTVPRGFV